MNTHTQQHRSKTAYFLFFFRHNDFDVLWANYIYIGSQENARSCVGIFADASSQHKALVLEASNMNAIIPRNSANLAYCALKSGNNCMNAATEYPSNHHLFSSLKEAISAVVRAAALGLSK